MELSTYFRINAANTGQFERTLIIADEGSHVSYLEGCTAPMRDENQLHAAVVELVALKDAEHQVFDGAELVSRRRERRRRHLQLRDQARRMPRRQFAHQLDAGGNRLGDHLEVPELRADRRQLGRRVLLGRAGQPLPAGRHRHQDDPHRAQYAQHDRLQGHFRRPRPEHLSRPGEGAALGRRRAQLHPVRLAADGRQVRRAHVPVHGDQATRPPSSSTRPPPRRSPTTSSSTAAAAACPKRTR